MTLYAGWTEGAKPKTILEGVTSIALGNDAEITIRVENVINASAQEITLNYDSSKLSYIQDSAVAIHPGTNIASVQSDTPGTLRLILTWIGEEDAITGNADLV